VTGVDLDAVEKIIDSGVKQLNDRRQVVDTAAEAFAATQNRVKTRANTVCTSLLKVYRLQQIT